MTIYASTDRGFAAALRKIATRSRSGATVEKASARFSRLVSVVGIERSCAIPRSLTGSP